MLMICEHTMGAIYTSSVNQASDKEKMKYRQVHNEDNWRIDLINDMLLVREGLLVIPNIDREENKNMLNFACSS